MKYEVREARLNNWMMYMRKMLLPVACMVMMAACAQQSPEVKEVSRIENVLASDDMRGRRAGSADIDRAADFIAQEFKKAGLQPINGKSYLQEFSMVRLRPISFKAEADGVSMDPKNLILV